MTDATESGIPTVEKTIGKMDEGEILRLNDRLQELKVNPHFQALCELVGIHQQKVATLATRQRALPHPSQMPTTVDGLIAQQVAAAYESGVCTGLGQWQDIVDKVRTTAERVRDVIEREDDER